MKLKNCAKGWRKTMNPLIEKIYLSALICGGIILTMLLTSGCAALPSKVSVPDKNITLHYVSGGECSEVNVNIGRKIRFVPPSKKLDLEACLCQFDGCAAMTTEELNRLISHLRSIMKELPRIGFLDYGIEIDIKDTLRGVASGFRADTDIQISIGDTLIDEGKGFKQYQATGGKR